VAVGSPSQVGPTAPAVADEDIWVSVLGTRLLLELHLHLLFRSKFTASRADTFVRRNRFAGYQEHRIAENRSYCIEQSVERSGVEGKSGEIEVGIVHGE
jgi:hypothetical protein